MQIQYYGDFCLKLTMKPAGRATEDVVVYTDLPEKHTGLRAPLGECHVAVFSFESRFAAQELGLKGTPVIIDSPGEYSAFGITIVGLATSRDAVQGAERGANTVYLIEAEDLRVVYLGALGHELAAGDMDRLGDVDILFIPAAGTDTIPVARVDDLVRALEPRVVIPIHYRINGMSSDLPDAATFCAALGNCPESVLTRYTVRKKDLEGKNMEIVLLARA